MGAWRYRKQDNKGAVEEESRQREVNNIFMSGMATSNHHVCVIFASDAVEEGGRQGEASLRFFVYCTATEHRFTATPSTNP